MKIDAGGQQCTAAGRTAAMLPPTTEFSMLAPRWKSLDRIEWNNAIPEYNTIPQNIKLVLQLVIPLIVYFENLIAKNLDSKHPFS